MPQVAHPAVQFPMPYAKHGFANDTNRDKTSKYQNPGIQPRNKIFEAGNCLHYFGFCHGAPPRRSFDLRLYRRFYSYYWSCSVSLARADPFGEDQAPWLHAAVRCYCNIKRVKAGGGWSAQLVRPRGVTGKKVQQ